MKKITLVLCLSLVGLVGMAQQTKSSNKSAASFQEQNSIIIRLNDHQEVVTIENTLISSNDFNRNIDIKNNDHELVHNTISTSKYDFKFSQEAFTYEDGVAYDDYTVNYDFDPLVNVSETVTI